MMTIPTISPAVAALTVALVFTATLYIRLRIRHAGCKRALRRIANARNAAEWTLAQHGLKADDPAPSRPVPGFADWALVDGGLSRLNRNAS